MMRAAEAAPSLDDLFLRLEDAGMAQQMAEYVAHAVLRQYREFDAYASLRTRPRSPPHMAKAAIQPTVRLAPSCMFIAPPGSVKPGESCRVASSITRKLFSSRLTSWFVN